MYFCSGGSARWLALTGMSGFAGARTSAPELGSRVLGFEYRAPSCRSFGGLGEARGPTLELRGSKAGIRAVLFIREVGKGFWENHPLPTPSRASKYD